jgi:hypothetical protein
VDGAVERALEVAAAAVLVVVVGSVGVRREVRVGGLVRERERVSKVAVLSVTYIFSSIN